MNTAILDITPTQAAQWLTHNTTNRRVRPATVSKYAADITNSEWSLTGGTIIIGSDSRLLDGQHRLMACVKANKPFKSVVVFGVDDATAFSKIDTGMTRTCGDVLDMSSEKYARPLACALSSLWNYNYGSATTNAVRPSNHQKISLLYENPKMRESVAYVHTFGRNMPQPILAVLDYIGRTVNVDKTAMFMEQMKTGANLSPTSPALFLREHFTGVSRYVQATKNIPGYRLAIGIKALNAHIAGNEIGRLVFSYKEQFPSVIGAKPYGYMCERTTNAGS